MALLDLQNLDVTANNEDCRWGGGDRDSEVSLLLCDSAASVLLCL